MTRPREDKSSFTTSRQGHVEISDRLPPQADRQGQAKIPDHLPSKADKATWIYQIIFHQKQTRPRGDIRSSSIKADKATWRYQIIFHQSRESHVEISDHLPSKQRKPRGDIRSSSSTSRLTGPHVDVRSQAHRQSQLQTQRYNTT